MNSELTSGLIGLVRAIKELIENVDGLVMEVRAIVQQAAGRKGGQS